MQSIQAFILLDESFQHKNDNVNNFYLFVSIGSKVTKSFVKIAQSKFHFISIIHGQLNQNHSHAITSNICCMRVAMSTCVGSMIGSMMIESITMHFWENNIYMLNVNMKTQVSKTHANCLPTTWKPISLKMDPKTITHNDMFLNTFAIMNTIQRCYLDQWGKQNTIQKAND
jgi:hypothetical protein